MSTLHRRRERGQSLVEFGLILPIFLLFIFGIIDLGRAVYAYHTLNSAAREAARVAVVDQTITHIQDEAIAQAMGLGLEADDISFDWRHANQQNVANSCASLLGGPEVASCTVTIRVEYDFKAATPIIGDIVGVLAMAGESSMIVEFNCQEPLPAGSPLSGCPAEE